MTDALWVFGYGSLIWRPGFDFAERQLALLEGLHRSLCVISHVHRGTAEKPGLVVGLDAGGSCRGVAFRVRRGDEADALAYLRAREQVTFVYREERRPVHLIGAADSTDSTDNTGGTAGTGGTRVEALCFVADPNHRQYGGALEPAEKVRLVRQGRGLSGASLDYLESLLASLDEMGIRDEGLARLHAQARRSARTGVGVDQRRPRAT